VIALVLRAGAGKGRREGGKEGGRERGGRDNFAHMHHLVI